LLPAGLCPSSPTPSSGTHDQFGPSRVAPHLPGSLAHMLARVRACQLYAPSRIASSSSTCECRTSGILPLLVSIHPVPMLVRTRVLRWRPSCTLPARP
jgi:hypothetical protein